jgi:hypothetical protein
LRRTRQVKLILTNWTHSDIEIGLKFKATYLLTQLEPELFFAASDHATECLR